MNVMRRLVARSVVLGLVAAFLLAVGPAAAKVPYFSVEVSPSDPVEGDAVVVVLRMWDDAAHTRPPTWTDEFEVELGLLEFRGDSGIVPVTFQRFDEGAYRAEVTLGAGTWQVVPFPQWGGDMIASSEGYSAPASVTVRERTDLTALAVVAAAGTLGILGMLAGRPAHHGLRRARSATG